MHQLHSRFRLGNNNDQTLPNVEFAEFSDGSHLVYELKIVTISIISPLRPSYAYISVHQTSMDRRQAIIWANAAILFDWTLENKLQWNLNGKLCIFIHEHAFQNVVVKMAAILTRPQCVNQKSKSCIQPLRFCQVTK